MSGLYAMASPRRMAGLLVAGIILSSCATQMSPEAPPGAETAALASGLPDGTEQYELLPYMSQVPFLVIETTSIGDDNLDYFLRDELVKVGFPEGITKAQLASKYIAAGMIDVARYVDDPVALHKLSNVVGPLLLLRVEYTIGGWGGASYRVEVWDARSARTVFVMTGKRVIWWSMAKEMGPPIVNALAIWRTSCLEAEKESADSPVRATT